MSYIKEALLNGDICEFCGCDMKPGMGEPQACEECKEKQEDETH